MDKQPDLNSPEYWEEKLTEAGMPDKPKEEDPLPKPRAETGEEELHMLSEAMMGVLEKYSSLPAKLQNDILKDVYAKHKEGWPFAKIADRTKLLVAKGTELAAMGPEDSDREYIPKASAEEIKLNEETEKFIKELERIKKEKEKQEQEYETPEENPDEEEQKPPKKEWIN